MSEIEPIRLRLLRRRYGITQEELEEASQVSQTTISHIERGIHSPTYEVLIKLMRGFHKLNAEVSWDELMDWEDEGKLKTNSATNPMGVTTLA